MCASSAGCGLKSKVRRNRMRERLVFLCITVIALTMTSCGLDSGPGSGGSSAPTASNNNASLNKDDYPVFPDADAGADPSVPAEQGGKGFTGEGWETNTSFDLPGDPRAAKGGSIQGHMLDFPGTFRTDGPESNTFFNYGVTSMLY